MSMKSPLTPAGIEPATFRFVAQHLNHFATAVPLESLRRGMYCMQPKEERLNELVTPRVETALKHVTVGKREGRTEVTLRRGRRRK